MAHRENAVPFDRRNNVEAPASRLVHDFGHFRARPEDLRNSNRVLILPTLGDLLSNQEEQCLSPATF
jgi:hypothetical protein